MSARVGDDRGAVAEEEDPLLRLVRAYGLERSRLSSAVANREGISLAEMLALEHLSFHGEMTPGRLGERLSLSSGAVTALIDRLDRHGWIERRPHPTDRRSTVLRLTAKAVAEGEEIFAPLAEAMQRTVAGLSPAERRGAERLLSAACEIVAANVERQDAPGPRDVPQ